MPTIPLHLSPSQPQSAAKNPLPQLLQTPSGLAIVEIQGTLNFPDPSPETIATPIGRFVFPGYNENDQAQDSSWQKTVHLYVGRHQRLTGEVKKLPKPLAIIRKRDKLDEGDEDELEISEIVHYKILFSSRPEPVGD